MKLAAGVQHEKLLHVWVQLLMLVLVLRQQQVLLLQDAHHVAHVSKAATQRLLELATLLLGTQAQARL